ncbi:inositol monophosphatase family protein [Bacillus sp. Marseille-P3661]|uniref:inositol monophosphatase family protein n=1 Tax=Bacillus sp. Marseille-P3661 TaxID=1936234 RepID=UPI000C83DD7C|nr:inositol monophosphatase family protein [Bacillus sp. Marseille-P3661]
MSQIDWEHIHSAGKEWILEAGKQIRRSFSETLTVEFKENASDLVTNMDKKIETYFISKIMEKFPNHRILGEEGQGDNVKSLEGTVWIIDPIDGTMNFVHLKRHFAISVGIYHDGIGMIGFIYDVVQDELYHAIKGKGAFLNGQRLANLQPVNVEEAVIGMNAAWAIEGKRIDSGLLPPLIHALRGTRSFGSAAIEMAFVASGRLDGYLSLRLSPWDYSAGKILIEEVGGIVTSVKGEPLNLINQSPLFAAKPGLHGEVVEKFINKNK